MSIIYSFITSDSAALLQFLLLLGVIAVLMLISIQLGNRLRAVDHENMQLKRDVGNLYEQIDRSHARLQNQLSAHEELLLKLGAHMITGELMTEDDFDLVGHSRTRPEAIVPDMVVELGEHAEGDGHRDFMLVPSDSFGGYDQDHEAADSSNGRSVHNFIDNRNSSEKQSFELEEQPAVGSADLLTRALRLSKTSGE